MTIYRFKTDTEFQYPFAKEQLRSIFKNVSFPSPIPDALAANYGCLPVQIIERPSHDPRTERIAEGDPEELEDGSLQQVLTVREATADEIATYDLQNAPAPQWVQFAGALGADPPVNQFVASLAQTAPVLHLMIGVGMGQAAGGDFTTFLAAWAMGASLGLVTPELSAHVTGIAQTFNLPPEFLAGL
jgi:hypothetical protein